MDQIKGITGWKTGHDVMKIFMSFFLSLLPIWILGAIFLSGPIVFQWDDTLGLPVAIEGTKKQERTENWNTFSYGKFGLEASDAQRAESKTSKYLLFGDSYVEANMVAPKDRIQARLSAMGLPCVGIGIVGGNCVEYNHLMDIYNHALANVHANILLIADISDILPPNQEKDFKSQKITYQFRKIEGRFGLLSYRLRLMAFRKILKNTELYFHHGIDYTGNHWCQKKKPKSNESNNMQNYEAYWRDMLHTLKATSPNGNLLIVYAPIVPHIHDNAILTINEDDEIFQHFEKVCHEFQLLGDGVLNLGNLFCEYTRTTYRFPRGFFNTPPGEGHLNAEGHRIVADAIAKVLQK